MIRVVGDRRVVHRREWQGGELCDGEEGSLRLRGTTSAGWGQVRWGQKKQGGCRSKRETHLDCLEKIA
jgi:hypothetical protein